MFRTQRTIYFLLISCLSLNLAGCKGPIKWYKDFNKKAAHVKSLMVKHEVLLDEHSKLRSDYLSLQDRYMSLRAQIEHINRTKQKIKVTGHKDGRTLASFKHRMPEKMSVKDQYLYGLELMKNEEFAAGVKVFEKLWRSPEGAAFQTSHAFYHVAVAWFKMKNYKKSQKFFEAADMRVDHIHNSALKNRIQLWMKVVNKKIGPTRKLASEAGDSHYEKMYQ